MQIAATVEETAMETVLVTGGAGYIGSHAVQSLMRNGYQAVVLDNLSKGHRRAVPQDVPLVVADVSDTVQVARTMRRYRVTAVLHFAAASLVGESMSEPQRYYVNNVLGTLHLLDAMRMTDIDRIVFSSTAAVYGEPARIPIPENSRLEPTNVYGWTKLIGERMLHDYAVAYGFRFVSLRYFNAAGADPEGRTGEDHDPETHLIPLVLRAAADRRTSLTIFGTDYPTPDGTCVRDYVHVNDLADAHILALSSLTRQKEAVYNLGSEKGFSVRQIIEAAQRVVGHDISCVEAERRPGDPAALVADSAKARVDLGWSPRLTDLEAIISTAWNWELRRSAFRQCS
jgi:UDP-glucose 4-epimerase